jgi:catechol 2,3-dioxygenase-like lactoylglutathione lyase family enzyme
MAAHFAARIDHAALAVADTDAVAKWYDDTLGFKIVVTQAPKPPVTQNTYLLGPVSADGIADGHMLEIMPKNASPRHERNSHEPGHSHLAFYVPDFEASLAHLRSHGVKFLTDIIPAVGGGRLISFQDIEGNMIQIVERK